MSSEKCRVQTRRKLSVNTCACLVRAAAAAASGNSLGPASRKWRADYEKLPKKKRRGRPLAMRLAFYNNNNPSRRVASPTLELAPAIILLIFEAKVHNMRIESVLYCRQYCVFIKSSFRVQVENSFPRPTTTRKDGPLILSSLEVYGQGQTLLEGEEEKSPCRHFSLFRRSHFLRSRARSHSNVNRHCLFHRLLFFPFLHSPRRWPKETLYGISNGEKIEPSPRRNLYASFASLLRASSLVVERHFYLLPYSRVSRIPR